MPPERVERMMSGLAHQVLRDLDLTRSIEHPGESGRAREQIITAFLQRLIPRAYDISTGFVIDARGDISKQIDLIIHRVDYHPVFEIGGVKFFPVESVVAVIENKALIDSEKRLTQALCNIASVKKLDRMNGGRNEVVRVSKRVDAEVTRPFYQEVFGAITTEESLSRKSLERIFLSFTEGRCRCQWPNLYLDVQSPLVVTYYRDHQHDRLTVDPHQAKGLAFSEDGCFSTQDSQGRTLHHPLVYLAFEITNLLSIAPIVVHDPRAYLVRANFPFESREFGHPFL